MQVKVKICGITNIDDAIAAVDFGADALGFVFFKGSPRYISPEDAAVIIKQLPPFITTIGVFVDEKPKKVEKIIIQTMVDIVQLHGNEPPDSCNISKNLIKAIRVKSLQSLDPLDEYKDRVCAFLLDTFTPDVLGGTGQIFNWDIAIYAKQFGRIILAGGLTHNNVAEAIRRVRPYGVDVSSGVESKKGKKDHKKLKLFIEKAKGA
ncbi:MAG: N-(5'-phosphoribosyl)anthranilate isomerase [Nitrospirae bacterium RBG_13_39_12]|nr:MAG: N-(5'-phosphoribosyl)anthranilate isomerase [Nitrospirae bacterium RBG_13_39_12]